MNDAAGKYARIPDQDGSSRAQAQLYDVSGRRTVPCRIGCLTIEDLSAARLSWGREFQRRGAVGVHDDDALIWTSGFLSGRCSRSSPVPVGFAGSASGEVQGIVLFDDVLRAGKARPRGVLTYVHYLATAPWNRGGPHAAVCYRGVGRLLVERTIAQSLTSGCQGRVGLHSFTSASGFYERLGFTNLGIDPAARGMTYFELRPDAAQALLAGNQ